MLKSGVLSLGCILLLTAAGRTVNQPSFGDGMEYPDIPRGVTSFGAAVSGDHLYIYGGHLGGAHRYSRESQSTDLMRLNLSDPSEWEKSSEGPGLQGLALVAHGDALYRVGGFRALNSKGEDHNLLSIADCVRFDLKAGEWKPMPSMPEPRSSHDAVVIGHSLYVAGGWALSGGDEVWSETAMVLNLNDQKAQWEKLPNPPFQRRALSLGQLGGKLVVVGGMSKAGGPTTEVAIFDPTTKKWSDGPRLPGEGMEGFGSSAFMLNGILYVSTYGGSLLALEESNDQWKKVTTLKEDRFFHRMVPYRNLLMCVGGASMTEGKRFLTEAIKP